MADTLRRVTSTDLGKISELYKFSKSVEELVWLFTDPEIPDKFNAFVAIDKKKKIIGVIGYVLSNYVQGEKIIQGVIPISWKISSDYQGFAGILLFKKVLEYGDFALAIQGSKIARKLYPIFKYKYVSKSDVYYKILNFPGFYNSIKNRNLFKRLAIMVLLLPSGFTSLRRKSTYEEVRLIPYDGQNFVEEKRFNNVFFKRINKNYLDWLLSCPSLNSFAFSIKKGANYFGMCVLYTQKQNSITRGRIVYIPFLGDDKKLWLDVVNECIIFFKKKKCSLISVLVHHRMCHNLFSKAGFIKRKNHCKQIYLKDNKSKLESLNLTDWYMQFTEGDKGYRDLHWI